MIDLLGRDGRKALFCEVLHSSANAGLSCNRTSVHSGASCINRGHFGGGGGGGKLVTPLLDLDISPVPTSEVSVVPMETSDNAIGKSVPSLLGMNLTPTCPRVQQVASATIV